MWKQVKNFDINKMGTKKGYCLQNVRSGFGIPAKYASAKDDMIANRNAGTLHDISTIPNNVAVPVYVDTASVYEHIIVCDRGTFYSDGVRLTSTKGMKFFGWGETCNGVRVVENVADIGLKYKSHIQDKGWTGWQDAGTVEGTINEARRIEAVIFEAVGGLDIKYRAHVQEQGWQEWKKSGEVAGTTGKSLRLEALEIQSNRILEAQEYLQNVGWMPVSTGTNIVIGTVGKALRLEAFRVVVK